MIPQAIREELGIVPQTTLFWTVRDGAMVVYPIPPDPITAAIGRWADDGPGTAELLEERRQERERDG